MALKKTSETDVENTIKDPVFKKPASFSKRFAQKRQIRQNEEHLINARSLMEYGEYDLASGLLGNFLKRYPSHDYALRLTSLCFKSLDEPYKFLLLLKELMGMSRLTVKRALIYADILRECGWSREAKSLYLQCLKIKGKKEISMDKSQNQKVFFELYKNLGDLSLKMNSVQEAESYYAEAFKIKSLCDALWVSYGTLEMKKGRIQEAVSYYRRAAEKNPENAMAWVGLALIHREHGDIELAWGNLERALDTSHFLDFAFQLALKWACQDSKEDVLIRILKNLKVLQSKEGRSAEIRFILAQILYKLGRYKQALEEMNVLKGEKKSCKGFLGMQFALKEALKAQSQFFSPTFA